MLKSIAHGALNAFSENAMIFKLILGCSLLFLAGPAFAANAAAVQAYQAGLKKMQAKNYIGASVDFSLALHEEPGYPEAQLQTAHCHYYLGAQEKAVAAYEDYLLMKPDDAKVKDLLKAIQSGAAQAEVKTYGKGAQRCYDAGMGFMKVKDYKKAILCFVEGVGYDRTMPEMWFQMGNSHYYNGDKAKALNAYEEHLKLKPEDAKTKAFVQSLRKSLPAR